MLQTKVLNGHSKAVECLQLSGDRLVSGSWDHTLRMWEISSGRSLRTLEGHGERVWCLQAHGQRIISGSTDRTMWVLALSVRTSLYSR